MSGGKWVKWPQQIRGPIKRDQLGRFLNLPEGAEDIADPRPPEERLKLHTPDPYSVHIKPLKEVHHVAGGYTLIKIEFLVLGQPSQPTRDKVDTTRPFPRPSFGNHDDLIEARDKIPLPEPTPPEVRGKVFTPETLDALLRAVEEVLNEYLGVLRDLNPEELRRQLERALEEFEAQQMNGIPPPVDPATLEEAKKIANPPAEEEQGQGLTRAEEVTAVVVLTAYVLAKYQLGSMTVKRPVEQKGPTPGGSSTAGLEGLNLPRGSASRNILHFIPPGQSHFGFVLGQVIPLEDPVVIAAANEDHERALTQVGFGGKNRTILRADLSGGLEGAYAAAKRLYPSYSPRRYDDLNESRLALWLVRLIQEYDIPAPLKTLLNAVRDAHAILKAA